MCVSSFSTEFLQYLCSPPQQDYWSLLDGDKYGTWVDARLTELGISQAKTAHGAWEKQIQRKIPSPQSYYVSPLNRCCKTAQVTFEGLDMPLTAPFRPTIKEVSRTHLSRHP
jgi:broad specificity phosphatase PhoE